jgi:hypothetical protein
MGEIVSWVVASVGTLLFVAACLALPMLWWTGVLKVKQWNDRRLNARPSSHR